MAIMIPNKPINIPENSHEDEMFIALSKLTDDYYVFHSFMIVTNVAGVQFESETDFVIFNRKKGILCLEAKAGRVYCKNGVWYYGSNIEMKHGGPYRQADQNKWKLEKYFEQKHSHDLWNKCKVLHAVWFPSIDKAYLNIIQFPPDADKTITLTKESLNNITADIEKLFSIQLPGNVETALTENEAKQILENILCPSFDLVPSVSSDLSVTRNAFNRLLKEQSNLLNFLEDQPFAVINGVAGTGKTMIAVEKARRHAEEGKKVLFLCFNRPLCDFLRKSYPYLNVSFYTIDAFACAFCKQSTADFELLQEKLEESYYKDTFPYQHVIIDEGQDFGQDRIEETNIIELLETIALSEEVNGSFYLFYDKNQLVQGRQIPKYISDSDCKLTLYKNCRNTENIAITSMRPLGKEKVPKMFEGSVKGESPNLSICEDQSKQIDAIDTAIKKYLGRKIDNIVILSCAAEGNSILTQYCVDGQYKKFNHNCPVTTCRKFKGLEADAIILVDVKEDTFNDQNHLMFYVGASRARFYLSIICGMSEAACIQVMDEMNVVRTKNPRKSFAAMLNALLS